MSDISGNSEIKIEYYQLYYLIIYRRFKVIDLHLSNIDIIANIIHYLVNSKFLFLNR